MVLYSPAGMDTPRRSRRMLRTFAVMAFSSDSRDAKSAHASSASSVEQGGPSAAILPHPGDPVGGGGWLSNGEAARVMAASMAVSTSSTTTPFSAAYV